MVGSKCHPFALVAMRTELIQGFVATSVQNTPSNMTVANGNIACLPRAERRSGGLRRVPDSLPMHTPMNA